MTLKFRRLPMDRAHECPFYLEDIQGVQHCMIQALVPYHIATAMVEDAPDYDPSLWGKPCGGLIANCGVLPLLYKQSDLMVADTASDTYDPFADEEEPSEEYSSEEYSSVEELSVEELSEEDSSEVILSPQTVYLLPATEAVAVTGSAMQEAEPINEEQPAPAVEETIKSVDETETVDETESVDETETVKAIQSAPISRVHLRQVNPYRANIDMLVLPISNALQADWELLDRTGMSVQNELDRIPRPTNAVGQLMGHVYTTTPGQTGAVKAKVLCHAVVAGASRLVLPDSIREATKNALRWAEANKIKTVAFVPFDCGTHDITEAANFQLRGIYEYFKAVTPIYIEKVYAIMEDEDSVVAYHYYFDRMFPGASVMTNQFNSEER